MKKISALIFFLLSAVTVYATVTNIHAVYKNGQVFVTWNNLSTTGVKYYLYKSSSPITTGAQLSAAQNLGYVIDSSGINKRLTSILYAASPIGLKIDSSGNPLSAAIGLFVTTVTANGVFYYAVTTVENSVEDTGIVAGVNSLSVTDSVTELIADPQPVWQQSYSANGLTAQIYVQYVTGITSLTYPLMTNAGSFPFNFSIYKPNNLLSPLVVKLHAGGGNFIQWATSQIVQGVNECRLSLDDWVPNSDLNSKWFGFHENYNIYSDNNPTHFTGTVRAYTLWRVMFTIDWVEKHYTIDTNRIYLAGTSMGAIGARTLGFLFPEKFAALILTVPKFNFFSLPEINLITDVKSPLTGNYLTGLQARCIDYLVHADKNLSGPFMIASNGKNDSIVGWSEKPPFYDTANVNLLGGAFYWDLRNHHGNGYNWIPNYQPLPFRFRLNLSYPAFTNCSQNGNPGNGTITDGDSVGTINGRIGWLDNIVDSVDHYKIILRTVDLSNQNLSGLFPAPDSAVADVTLRRLQLFHPPIGSTIFWMNKKYGGTVLQHGCFVFNGGLITVHGIKIYEVTDTLFFSLTPVFSTDTFLSICNGSNYILPWGAVVTAAGTYSHIYSVNGNCDSLVSYFVSLNPVYNNSVNESICQGYNFYLPWGGTVTVGGIYSHVYTSVTGCDSLVNINLSVNPTFVSNSNASICEGSVYYLPWGMAVTASGTYNNTYSTVNGCDSIIIVNLTIDQQYDTIQNVSICEGANYNLPWGEIAASDGTYTHTYNSVNGCDSVVNVVLTVIPAITTHIDTTIYAGSIYFFPWGDSTSSAGNYSFTYLSISGCDSVVDITISVAPDGTEENFSRLELTCSVFPNPVAAVADFTFNKNVSGIIFIADLAGRKISKTEIKNEKKASISFSAFPNGIYFADFIDEHGISNTQKIIVSR